MIFLFAFILIYAAFIAAFTFASSQKKSEKSQNNSPSLGISIVVALRNEEHNVEKLIQSLQNQHYPSNLFEIILVDDHSTDTTLQLINSHPSIRVVKLGNKVCGKKAALKAGVSIAKFPFAALTDADCRPNPNWIKSISLQEDVESTSLVVAPVAMVHTNGIISAFQYWEFKILQTVTFGSAKLGIPVMCNGANLLVKTSDYQNIDLKEDKSPSGDDIFLLHHLLKYEKKVCFLQNRDATVYTIPESNFKCMLQQQLRWASKSKYYQHPTTIILGIITLFANFGLVALFTLTAIDHSHMKFLLIALGLKISVEAIAALLSTKNRQENAPSIFSFLLSSIAMPFYATFVAVASVVVKPKWKDR